MGAVALLVRRPEIVGDLDGVERAAWSGGVFALPPATCAAVLVIVVIAALVPGSLAARRSPSRALRAE